MPNIQINGFDESGIIGGNLRFVRVGLKKDDELRFYIYNLIHFGSVIVPKNKMLGLDTKLKKEYVKHAFNDPNIIINHYFFPPLHQLDLLRCFAIEELYQVALRRQELISYVKNQENIVTNINNTIKRMKKYTHPAKYTEWYIKSYAYKNILKNLQRKSKILVENPDRGNKVISLVDGGYPMVFWSKNYLESENNNHISKHNAPIFGITNGDICFPTINFAGNIASILNQNPNLIYPQNIEDVIALDEEDIKKHYYDFLKNCSQPKFLPRMLFFGEIDVELKNCIPYIKWRYSSKLYELMKVRYPIAKFYSTFRGDSKHDIIIKGKKPLYNQRKASEYEKMEQECKEFGINTSSPLDFFDGFTTLLDEIKQKSYESNLGKSITIKIDNRIEKTKDRIKKYLKIN